MFRRLIVEIDDCDALKKFVNPLTMECRTLAPETANNEFGSYYL